MDKVIIIGGGLGGLFCGAILSKEGKHMTVLEKNATIGGGLQTFTRFGETFDTGMHVVGGMQPGGNVWRICRYLGIADKVTFAGRVTDRERLKQYYAAADLFLFPSLYDTDGLVVREAAALDTPSVMLKEASASGMLTDGETGFKIAGRWMNTRRCCARWPPTLTGARPSGAEPAASSVHGKT